MKLTQKRFWFAQFFLKLKQKKKGSVLLISIILSGMILSISAGTAKILMKEVEFTSDLLFAEKSYFAAESGVETALLELNETPVRNIVDQNIPFQNQSVMKLTIENRKDSFDLKLTPNGNKKFQLKRQTNENDLIGTPTITTEKVENFMIENPTSKKFHWKILCKKDTETVAIQNDFENTNFNSQTIDGILEDENGNIFDSSSLETFLQNNEYQNCFLSLENLTEEDTIITIKAPNKMAPDKAKIISTGKSGNREKRIVFEYAQKNLGSLFDFVFFHSDEGI